MRAFEPAVRHNLDAMKPATGTLRQALRGGDVGKGGLLALGEGGSFFCAVLSHVASVVKKKRTDRAVSPCYVSIARMFCGVKRGWCGGRQFVVMPPRRERPDAQVSRGDPSSPSGAPLSP